MLDKLPNYQINKKPLSINIGSVILVKNLIFTKKVSILNELYKIFLNKT